MPIIPHTESSTLRDKATIFHPDSNGRVVMLKAPYILPQEFDLSRIAGIVFERKQNAAVSALLHGMDDDSYHALTQHEATFKHGVLQQRDQVGPRAPAPFSPPEPIRFEIQELSEAFNRIAGGSISIRFPRDFALKFHTDGIEGKTNAPEDVEKNSSWRLTYAFTEKQTLWHKRVPAPETMLSKSSISGGLRYIEDEDAGVENSDYFEASGALMFRIKSSSLQNQNALIHRSPNPTDKRRFVVSFDKSF